MSAQPMFTQMMVAPPLHRSVRNWLDELRGSLWRCDLASLLAGLRSFDYGWDELRFAGNASCECARGLIEDVELQDDPRRVRITLNLGLLGPQSPLPGYFFKELDAGTLDAATFFDFIGFFDHAVLSRLLLAIHPELDRKLLGDHDRTRREDLQFLNLHSPSTLHWLFQQLFPELAVRVEPMTKERRLRTGGMRLGSVTLGGDGTFGSRAVVAGPGRRVILFSDEECAGSGRPWPLEARTRLETHVVPLVRPFGVALETFLVVREQQSWARLTGMSHLGYEQLRGAGQARRIKLYDSSEEEQP